MDLAVQSNQCVDAAGQEEAQYYNDLNGFLSSVERRAFRIARFALGNDDDALDAVQDAMMKLVSHYQNKSSGEWPALFHRILQNRIKDHHRRHAVRNRWLSWFDQFGKDDEDIGINDTLLVDAGPSIESQLNTQQGLAHLDTAIENLPNKQQQVFLLRCWEGLSTRETAKAVGCSEGSVKTHYFRALNTLKTTLSDYAHDEG